MERLGNPTQLLILKDIQNLSDEMVEENDFRTVISNIFNS